MKEAIEMGIANTVGGTYSRNELTLDALGNLKLVYIRPVRAGDVLDELTDEAGNMVVDIPEETTLFSLHAADGERIALMGDRDMAFAAARQHEMTPVSVH